MAGDEKTKIAINGNTSGYDPTFQDNVTMAIAQNEGAHRVRAVLQQRLDECGWTQNLRNHLLQIFRSGEVETYDEAMKNVTQHIRLPTIKQDESISNGEAPNLTIPMDVAKDVAEVVKKEIAQVVKMAK